MAPTLTTTPANSTATIAIATVTSISVRPRAAPERRIAERFCPRCAVTSSLPAAALVVQVLASAVGVHALAARRAVAAVGADDGLAGLVQVQVLVIPRILRDRLQ